MKNTLLTIIVFGIALSAVLFSCKKTDNRPMLKVGLVTGIGGLNDAGFNQMAYTGLLNAASQVSIEWEVKESNSSAEIENNINYFTDKKVDVIISLGYDAAEPTLNAALSNPSIKFFLLDYYSASSQPNNLMCATFQIDQASFPCGFLAAYWACHENPLHPSVSYVAGPGIPEIQQFTVSFVQGVNYFNTAYQKDVSISGVNARSFNDTVEGARLADSLILKGSEVLFACAGKTGNGALAKVQEKSKTGIGVDTDQFYTIPQVSSILLTSCMKRLDVAVEKELLDIANGNFHGGQNLQSSLANQGVDLAPYHNYETLLPDSIKQAVLNLKTGIKNGVISTGWPE